MATVAFQYIFFALITASVRISPTVTKQCPTETVNETNTIDRPSQCPPVIVTTTVTTASIIPQCETASPPVCSSTTSVNECDTKSDTTVKGQLSSSLGVLLGLAIVALVIVTTGWVWTYWILKKRAGMKVNMEEQVG